MAYPNNFDGAGPDPKPVERAYGEASFRDHPFATLEKVEYAGESGLVNCIFQGPSFEVALWYLNDSLYAVRQPEERDLSTSKRKTRLTVKIPHVSIFNAQYNLKTGITLEQLRSVLSRESISRN